MSGSIHDESSLKKGRMPSKSKVLYKEWKKKNRILTLLVQKKILDKKPQK
jgi:hypothetical protein